MWNNIMRLYDHIEGMPPLYTDVLNANIIIDINKQGSITKIEKLDKIVVMNVPSTLAAENRSSTPAPYPVIDLIKNMSILYFDNLKTMMDRGVNTPKLNTFCKCVKSNDFFDKLRTFSDANKLIYNQLCPYVTIDGVPLLDDELYEMYNAYYRTYILEEEGERNLSMLSYEYTYCTRFGKRKVLPDAPMAKIFSTQYTKKHPVETGREAPDIYIGITDSFKFHHSLRYLISNGYRWNNVTLIAWNESGSIPVPIHSLSYYVYNATGEMLPHTNLTEPPYSTIIKTSTDLFVTLDAICRMYIDKYADTVVHIAGFSAPSKGNINTVYYDTIPAAEYFNNLTKHYKDQLQNYSTEYYRFDGILEVLKFIGADQLQNLSFFTNMLKNATRRETIYPPLQAKMMYAYDIIISGNWYTLSYFSKFFADQKNKDSFAYILGRWVGICAALITYTCNERVGISTSSSLFQKVKHDPFIHMSILNKYVVMCENKIGRKSNYLIDIKSSLSEELLQFDLKNSSANNINYYLGYEDQLCDIVKINKSRFEKNETKRIKEKNKQEPFADEE